MVSTVANSVRSRREAAGLTQAQLARACGVSRQSLASVEIGKAVPGVDLALRLASALDCRVEDLFVSDRAETHLSVKLRSPSGPPIAGGPGSRVALAHVRGSWVGTPLVGEQMHLSADALLCNEPPSRRLGAAEGRAVLPLRSLDGARENLWLQGCASGLGLLADRAFARQGVGRCWWFSSSSAAALQALARGETHIAGVHHQIGGVEDKNIDAVRRAAIPEATVLVSLARWEAGLLARRGDFRVSGIASLDSPKLHLAVRESGSGARELLERSMQEYGIECDKRLARALPTAGHLDVARNISLGIADAGVATRDAAMAFGLQFIPLAEERYDLVLPKTLANDARVSRLLDALTSISGRRDLESLGYEVACSGSVVGEVSATSHARRRPARPALA